jgi:spermidine/putrescine transport system ATP-binding protein
MIETDEIEFNNVSMSLSKRKIVNNISFSVAKGEFLSIIGPSGCGKTTLLKMLVGALTPTSGRIYFRGRDVIDIPPERRQIIMVWQQLALFPHMTVGENVGFGLTMRKVHPKEVKIRTLHILESMGLMGYEKRSVHQLSGGERQRVALARALILEPKVLLLDEPLNGLDPHNRSQMLAYFRAIQRNAGMTLIMVTHDQSEAIASSARICIIKDGKIEQIGAPDEINDRPCTAFVARFVGDNNIITGTLREIEDGRCVVDTAAGQLTAMVPDWIDANFRDGCDVSYVVNAHHVTMDANSENSLFGSLDVHSFGGGLEQIEILVPGVGSIRSLRPCAKKNYISKEIKLYWSFEDAYILPN